MENVPEWLFRILWTDEALASLNGVIILKAIAYGGQIIDMKSFRTILWR